MKISVEVNETPAGTTIVLTAPATASVVQVLNHAIASLTDTIENEEVTNV